MLKNTIKKMFLRLFTFSSALFMMNFNVLADSNSNTSENEISVLADVSLKGDLDENGTLTYSDLSILQQYLAGTKQLSANQLDTCGCKFG